MYTEKLRIREVAESDSIPAELIKQGGTEIKSRIYKLIVKIWDEETLPTECMGGIICPICKKGDRMICSNYRPITLLNIKGKSVLLQARRGPEGSKKLRFPDFVTMA